MAREAGRGGPITELGGSHVVGCVLLPRGWYNSSGGEGGGEGGRVVRRPETGSGLVVCWLESQSLFPVSGVV